MIEKICQDCESVFYPKTDKARFCPSCFKKRLGEVAKAHRLNKAGNDAYSKQQASKKASENVKPKHEVAKCPKGCIHEGRNNDGTPYCGYIFDTGHRRPCPAGPDCSEYKKGTRCRKRPDQWDDY